jgi:hypothetical protein
MFQVNLDNEKVNAGFSKSNIYTVHVDVQDNVVHVEIFYKKLSNDSCIIYTYMLLLGAYHSLVFTF